VYINIIARCYAERGIATASRLSARDVELRYRDHNHIAYVGNLQK